LNLPNKTAKLLDVYSFFDLQTQIHALEGRDEQIASKTLLKTDDLRIVLTVLRNGAKLGEHHADARLSIHILRGAVNFSVGENLWELRANTLIPLEPSVAHTIEALESSALLMTMAWPTGKTLRLIPHRGYS
jgi:quercetin dioxygenase-like cupin family protein